MLKKILVICIVVGFLFSSSAFARSLQQVYVQESQSAAQHLQHVTFYSGYELNNTMGQPFFRGGKVYAVLGTLGQQATILEYNSHVSGLGNEFTDAHFSGINFDHQFSLVDGYGAAQWKLDTMPTASMQSTLQDRQSTQTVQFMAPKLPTARPRLP